MGFGVTVAAVWMVTLGAGVASAHAFLVGSSPAQGARLGRPPTVITLSFSETVVASATKVTVRLAGRGARVPATVEPGGNSDVIRVRLASTPNGIYVVSWQDLSAEDGHVAFGEFAYAAGPVSGAVPVAGQGGGSPDPVRVAGTVLFLFGLAAAAGGALTGLVVDRSVTATSAGVRVGLLASLAGPVVVFIDDLGPLGSGLSHAAVLTGIAGLLATSALYVGAATRRRLPVLVLLVAAGVIWAADGHPAISGGALGLAINAVHLVVGALWVGTLGYLVAAVVRHRAERDVLLGIAGRYSRLALPLIVVLAAAGGLSAAEVLPSWSSLLSSGYGQLILAKSALFALALGLAAWNRRRGVGRHQATTLRKVVPVEAAVVAVIVVVTGFLANAAPPVAARPVAALLGPAPLSGPVARAAGLAGELNVAVAAGSGQVQVQVWAPDATPVAAQVNIDAFYPDGKDVGLFPRPCGTGCFTQTVNLPDGPTRFEVTAHAHGWSGGTWTGTVQWPAPPEDPQLLSRLVATMNTVPVVAGTETVTSNTNTHAFTTRLAPMSGRKLMALEFYSGERDQPGQPGAISDVQPLTVGGPGLQVFLPGTSIWATLWLDGQGRLARDRIVDFGHLITDTFAYPNDPSPPSPG